MFLKFISDILWYVCYLVLIEKWVCVSGECKVYLIDNGFSYYGSVEMVGFINRLGC